MPSRKLWLGLGWVESLLTGYRVRVRVRVGLGLGWVKSLLTGYRSEGILYFIQIKGISFIIKLIIDKVYKKAVYEMKNPFNIFQS